jgi:hypothetical protein
MVDKRQVRREFKERVTAKGILAVRCSTSGETWVTGSPDLSAWQTGILFGLRTGNHHNKSMQAAWNLHGADAFQFEILETMADDLAPMTLRDSLRDRQKHWMKELGAKAV